MEEKERYGCRYIRGEFDVFIDNETDKYLTIQEVKHLLNQQDKENQQLKQELDKYKETVQELQENNSKIFDESLYYRVNYNELKQQLEESKSEIEKQKQKYDNLYKCYQKTSSDDLQDKYHLAEEIDQLKQQLANSETKIKDFEFMNKNLEHSLKVAPNANAGQRARIVELKEINHRLKQQLHDLPKKIVREIKEFGEPMPYKQGNKPYMWIIGISDLSTILKKYGGENE